MQTGNYRTLVRMQQIGLDHMQTTGQESFNIEFSLNKAFVSFLELLQVFHSFNIVFQSLQAAITFPLEKYLNINLFIEADLSRFILFVCLFERRRKRRVREHERQKLQWIK